jgi:DNA-binding FadR family transcriptional regulator
MSQYSGRGVHGQTVEVLARRVLSGQFAEGSTLDIGALQSELGVSQTALRESLKVLAAKGMVDARQKRGTFVRPRAHWNLLDADVLRWRFADNADARLLDNLIEVRRIVEPAAVRLAAERRSDADLEALGTALDAMSEGSDDPARAVEADLAFHLALMAATHNELLQRLQMVLESGLAARDRLVHDSGHGDDPEPSHRAVFEAIRSQDPQAAEDAMRTLLDKASSDQQRIQSIAGRKAAK